jgi:hypothetical protein
MYVDRFGWIPRPLDVQGSFGELRTVSDFDNAVTCMKKRFDYEGYAYAPCEDVATWRESHEASNISDRVIRPASIYRLPATHELRLAAVSDDPAILRNADSGFLIHFLGFLLGYRCQFWDWWVDLRISVRSQADYDIFSPNILSKCLDLGISSWRDLEKRERIIVINAMFLHNRGIGYQWDWERLHTEYQVLDAFYAVAKTRFKLPNSKHAKRIEILCKQFGLYRPPDLIARIVDLRNKLIHETLWGGQMPCTAPDEETFYAPIWLHKFNQRLGLAILGFKNEYVSSRWNTLSSIAFRV